MKHTHPHFVRFLVVFGMAMLQIRRCYIQLLAEVVKHLGGLPSKMFHGDLRLVQTDFECIRCTKFLNPFTLLFLVY